MLKELDPEVPFTGLLKLNLEGSPISRVVRSFKKQYFLR